MALFISQGWLGGEEETGMRRTGGGHPGSSGPKFWMLCREIKENYSEVTGGGAGIQVEARVTGGGRAARVVSAEAGGKTRVEAGAAGTWLRAGVGGVPG